jgi:hypothetical protein
MKNTNINWQKQLDETEWSEFLIYSHNDEKCNEVWRLYKQQLLSYEEICEYEQLLYLQLKREKILNYFIK